MPFTTHLPAVLPPLQRGLTLVPFTAQLPSVSSPRDRRSGPLDASCCETIRLTCVLTRVHRRAGREPGVLQKLSVESRQRLNGAGAPALVLAHLRRVHERALADLTVRPSVAVALTALLNLSASKDCQVGCA